MNPEVESILSNISELQYEWVIARLTSRHDKDASKRVGIHAKTPYTHWKDVKPDLDRAVALLRRERAESALIALENLALKAVGVLDKAMDDKHQRVQAAKEVLSRVIPEKREQSFSGALKIEYVNDWRPNPLTESAHGADNGKATSPEVQLAIGGPAVAKNDNGNVHSG